MDALDCGFVKRILTYLDDEKGTEFVNNVQKVIDNEQEAGIYADVALSEAFSWRDCGVETFGYWSKLSDVEALVLYPHD